jgi:hypothetical protein
VRDFLDYLQGLVAGRRAKLGDPEHDVLTRLIAGERGGEELSELELLHNIIFILNAGHETTTNLIGNGLYLLLEWPDAKAKLIGNPALIRPAVEEILRFESSNQLGNRLTTAPSDIGGVRLPAGTFLTLGIGAANRDPAEFPNPDHFDVAREPNRHLAFGSGAPRLRRPQHRAPRGARCHRPAAGALPAVSFERAVDPGWARPLSGLSLPARRGCLRRRWPWRGRHGIAAAASDLWQI